MTWHLTDYTISSCCCRYLGSKWKKPLDTLKCLNSPTAKAKGLSIYMQGLPISHSWKHFGGKKTLSLKRKKEKLHDSTVQKAGWSLNALSSFMTKYCGAKEGEKRPICLLNCLPPSRATVTQQRRCGPWSPVPLVCNPNSPVPHHSVSSPTRQGKQYLPNRIVECNCLFGLQ